MPLVTPARDHPSRWFTQPRPNAGAALRLFAFPYAGGGPQAFRTWPQHLPDSVELYCAQLPGRGSRVSEIPFDRVPLLVHALDTEIRPLLDRPFAFYGHSMGGLVAFELARALRRQGSALPSHLFVSACFAPQNPDPFPMHHLPDQEFLAALHELNGIPGEVLDLPELVQLLLPTLRADCALTETYRYTSEPPLACPVLAFGGTDDPLLTQSDLAAWNVHTSKGFSLRMLPGDHFFLRSSESLLLAAISRALQEQASLASAARS